jgi:hypothetical protein|tara:strand:- start:1682 stop:2011 length:330 start_codon:yes stop_codon:yes gene_type:complete
MKIVRKIISKIIPKWTIYGFFRYEPVVRIGKHTWGGERACWLGFSNVGCDLKLYMGTWIIRISLFDFSVKAWHNRHYYKTGVQYNYWKYGILPPMPHKDFVQWKIRRSI